MSFGTTSPSGYSAPTSSGYQDPSSQPGPNALILGSVHFATSECPDDLEFGLQTHMHVTDVIGGGRVVQTFGTHPEPVSWTGRIWGPNVETRITALRGMLVAQTEIQISHKTEKYYCVVREFKAKRFAVDAQYTITVEITRDANGAVSSASATSVDSQISTLTSNASNQASAIANVDAVGGASMQQQVTNVQGALIEAGPVSQLTGSSLTTAFATVTAASAAAKTYASGVPAGAPQYVASQQLVTSFNLIGRNIQQGQSASTIQSFGGSLADICATHYGNVDLWPQLGAANGISGLRLPPGVLTTLKLPPFAVVGS